MPGDTNGVWDVFVKDRQTGRTERVSVDSNGVQGNDYSSRPSFSADGRYVAFVSNATNLVPNYSGNPALFIHDRQTGLTQGLLVDPKTQSAITPDINYAYAPSMSADLRFVPFETIASLVKTDLNGSALQPVYFNRSASVGLDVYVQERATSTSALTVSPQSLAFGNQATNTTSAARPVTVTNTGSHGSADHRYCPGRDKSWAVRLHPQLRHFARRKRELYGESHVQANEQGGQGRDPKREWRGRRLAFGRSHGHGHLTGQGRVFA